MWAQYAGSHTGVCLLFDKQVLNDTLVREFGHEMIYSGSVEYGNFHDAVGAPGWMKHWEAFQLSADEIKAHGLEKVLQEHRHKYYRVFFFRKNKDWENEAEYRWIVRGDTNDPVFIPIQGALRAILLYRFSNRTVRRNS
jgi:hypothetical protein